MKSMNIKDLELNIDMVPILNAVSTKSPFEIDINGKIYINKVCPLTIPIIYKSKNLESFSSILDANTIAMNLFSKEFKAKFSGSFCCLKLVIAWQNIIGLNQDRMLYFDHQSDGVELFEDKNLEDIGWNAVALDITYRELSEFIEKECDGMMLYYDNEVQFNGFVIVEDSEKVCLRVCDYICSKIKLMTENGELDMNDLDDDQEEAIEFFGIKG